MNQNDPLDAFLSKLGRILLTVVGCLFLIIAWVQITGKLGLH